MKIRHYYDFGINNTEMSDGNIDWELIREKGDSSFAIEKDSLQYQEMALKAKTYARIAKEVNKLIVARGGAVSMFSRMWKREF